MQRQSLGSPSSKLPISAGKEERQDEEEEKRKQVQEEDKREEKLLLRSSSPTDKSIHLIPLLTIFCLLVLYLFSYDPSQKDMENAGVREGYFRRKDPTEVGDFERLVEMGNTKSAAILGRRALKEARKGAISFRPSDPHRKLKFGYF